jgi:hypothetical protein
MRRSLWLLLLPMLATSALLAQSQASDVQVSHANTAAGALSAVSLRHNSMFEVLIYDTDTNCYDYAINGVIPAPAATAVVQSIMFSGPPPDTTRILLKTKHMERVQSYTVRATKKANAAQTCTLQDKTWTIPVAAFWNMSVSGAFLLDGLTDRVFFLEAGKGRLPGDSADRDGFYVRENTSGRDDFHKGFAVMTQLYYDSARAVDWVPLSIGFTSVNNDTVFLISPAAGLRLGSRVYLSAGLAFGQRNRLPNGLVVDEFITEATALNTIPRESKAAWYFAASLSFVEMPLSKFRNLFSPPQ